MTTDFSTLPPRIGSVLASIANMSSTGTPAEGTNPVMGTALRLSDALESGTITFEDVTQLVRTLRDQAFLNRSRHLHRYVAVPRLIPHRTSCAMLPSSFAPACPRPPLRRIASLFPPSVLPLYLRLTRPLP